MLTKAAVLFNQPGKWEVVELELEPPRQGELLIKWRPPDSVIPTITFSLLTYPNRPKPCH